MVHKKYIKINGKSYGPYFYESYRENGHVKKRYVKGTEAKNESIFGRVKKPILVFSLVFLALLLVILFMGNLRLQGNAILEVRDSYNLGENLSGVLKLSLGSGGFSNSSIVSISLGGQKRDFSFSDLIDLGAINISSSDLIYPDVYFTLLVSGASEDNSSLNNSGNISTETNESESVSGSGSSSENQDNSSIDISSVEPVENSSSEENSNSSEVPVAEASSGSDSEISSSSEISSISDSDSSSSSSDSGSSDSSLSSSSSSEGSSDGGSSGITGNVIGDFSSEEEISGKVSAGSDFEYALNGKNVKIKSGSVYSDYENLNEDILNLKTNNDLAIVSTNYSYTNSSGEKLVSLDLAKLGLLAQTGKLEVSIIENNSVLASYSKNVQLINSSLNETLNETINETVNLSFAIIKEIGEINLDKGSNLSLNLGDYFSGAESYSVNSLKNISLNVGEGILNIVPEENFTGKKIGRIVAYAGNETLNQSFIINVAEIGAYNISTRQYQAVVGKPVRWVKTVSVNSDSNGSVLVELPKEAQNISIETNNIPEAINNAEDTVQNSLEDKNSLITGNVVASSSGKGIFTRLLSFFKLTGNVIDESLGNVSVSENEDSKVVDVTNEANQTGDVAVFYETPAPVKNETEVSDIQKDILISSDKEYNYTNILAYTSLDNQVVLDDSSKIHLYWNASYEDAVSYGYISENSSLENDSFRVEVNFSYYDLDDDGNIDYIEWNVPHLSNQSYQIIIAITKAEYLDSNRKFISDVYGYVKTQDNNWTTIPNGSYLRVTFEQNLTNQNDITIYARANNNSNFSNYSVGVYRVGDNNVLARFDNLSEGLHKIFLTGLRANESLAVFDLKSLGDIDYDYVVDPSGFSCDAGDVSTTCNISTLHTIPNATVMSANNLNILNGGSLFNNSVTCSNHGCDMILNLTGNLTIYSGGNITGGNISIVAANVNLQANSSITADTLGWATSAGPGYSSGGGGTYGGRGGNNPILPYGDAGNPVDFGSPGNVGGSYIRYGGGIVFMNLTGALTVNGNISVLGSSGYPPGAGTQSSGGSGGSIRVNSNSLAGSGSILAAGGSAPGSGSQEGGGGGRIALYWQTSSYSGIIDASGGIGADINGRPGTLVIANGSSLNLSGGNVSFAPGIYNLNVLNISNNSILEIQGSNATTNGSGVVINAANISIASGSLIDGRYGGFPPGQGPGYKGAGYGSAHGGFGSSNNQTYGSETWPLEIGSGGGTQGGYAVCFGAGAVFLNATDTLSINGNLNFSTPGSGNSYANNPGSGGSILISARNFNLTGVLDVTPGPATNNIAPASGGGRIAIYSTNFVHSGNITNSGGLDNTASQVHGSAGTIYINNSNSVNSTGNVYAYGYNGSSAKISFNVALANLSGKYNASSIVAPQGFINMTYQNCDSLFSGTFSPSYTKSSNCVDCVASYIISWVAPLNNSYTGVSSYPVQLSTPFTSNSCNISVNGAANASMTLLSPTMANYTTGALSQGYNNLTAYCSNNLGGNTSSSISFLTDLIAPQVSLVSPTPSTGSYSTNNYIYVNATSSDSNLNVTFVPNFDNSLVSWYQAEGNANDVLGKNNGTAMVYENYSIGKRGRAFGFNGSNYINARNDSSLNPGSGNFSVFAWIKVYNTSNVSNAIVSKEASTENARYYLAVRNAYGKLAYSVRDSNTNSQEYYFSGSPNLFDNNWHYVGMIIDYSNKNLTGYVDGSLIGSVSLSNLNGLVNSSKNFTIGARNQGTSDFFSGFIDDVQVFNRSLSLSEISVLYSNYSSGIYSNNFTNLADGAHNIKVFSQDLAGNLNSTETRIITLDSTKPLISFTTGTQTNNTYISNNFVYANVSVTEANPSNITYYLYNSTGLVNSSNYLMSSQTSNSSINFSGLVDGVYYYNATIYDSSGNSNSTETRKITLDNVNPQLSYGLNVAVDYANLSQNFIFVNTSLVELNLANITYSLYNSTSLVNSTTYTNSVTSINFTNLADGVYYYNVSALDLLSKTNSTSTRTATLDTVSPVITISYPASANYTTIINSINYSFVEANPASCWYSLDSGVTNVSVSCSSNVTGLVSPQGSNFWKIWMNDSAGHLSSSSVSFIIDTIAPQFVIIPSDQNISYGVGFGYSVGATDAVSGVSSYRLNDSRFVINSTGFITNNSILPVGVYAINESVNDSFGNLNSSVFSLTINKATSVCLLTVNNATYPSPISVSGSCTNPEASAKLYYGSTQVTNPYFASFAAGNYNFTLNVSSSQNYTSASNSSLVYELQATPSLAMSVSPSSSVAYPTQTNIGTSGCPSQLTCRLYRDGVSVPNPDIRALGYGNYSYVYNTSGNTNYSAYSVSNYLNVSKNSGNCGLFFNETQPLEYGNQLLVWTDCSSAVSLYLNGSSISNNSAQFLDVGVWNFSVFRNDAVNYSNIFQEQDFSVVDTQSPVVHLVSPLNNSYSNSGQQTFTCNVSDNFALSDISVYAYGDSGLVYYDVSSLTGNASNNSWLAYLPGDGNYKYECRGTDSSGNVASSSDGNYSFTLDSVNPFISYGLNVAADYSNFSRNWIFINASTSDLNPANVTFSLYNSSGLVNLTSFNLNSMNSIASINFSGLADGLYSYQVNVSDLAGNLNSVDLRHITLDTTSPVISNIDPANNSWIGDPQQVLALSTNEDAVCRYSNTTQNYSLMNSFSYYNGTFFNLTLSGLQHKVNYTYYIKCNDSLGNLNINPSVYYFKVWYNVPPLAPTLVTSNNSAFSDVHFALEWDPAYDDNEDPLTYNIQISNLTNFSYVFVNRTDLDSTISSDFNLSDGIYYWRVRAKDPRVYGNWSEVRRISLDITPPYIISKSKVNARLNGTASLAVIANDSISGLNNSIASITYPNLSVQNFSMSLVGNNFTRSFSNLSIGDYLVTYFISDNANNILVSNDSFEFYIPQNISGSARDSLGNPENLTFRFYIPGSQVSLYNFSASGAYVLNSDQIHQRNYDLQLVLGNSSVLLRNVTINSSSIPIQVESYSAVSITNYKILGGIAVNTSYLGNASVGVAYSGLGTDTAVLDSGLTIHKCSGWNYVSRTCPEGFTLYNQDSVSVDNSSHSVSMNTSNFSLFVVSGATCGNSWCQLDYGETVTTCPQDCIPNTNPTPSPGAGGGGGGGGGGSSNPAPAAVDTSGLGLAFSEISYELSVGQNESHSFPVSNSASSSVSLDLALEGDIGQVLTLPSDNLVVPAGGSNSILFLVNGVKEGFYSGNLVIKGAKELRVPVKIVVRSKNEQLLDLDVRVENKEVSPGSDLVFKLAAFNLGQSSRYDLNFNYQIEDANTNKTIVQKQEVVAIETSLNLERSLKIPANTPEGNYILVATAFYNNITTTSNVMFSVKKTLSIGLPPIVKEVLPIAMSVIVLVFLFISGYYYFTTLRKKLFEKKLEEIKKSSPYIFPDFDKLPHSKFACIGLVADTNVKSYLDYTQLNRHTLIAGGTGSGKTIAGMDVVEEVLKKDQSVIVFDPVGQWTGFFNKNNDKAFASKLRKFGVGGPRAFKGEVFEITPATKAVDIIHYMNKKGLTILKMDKLSPKDVDDFVDQCLDRLYRGNLNESTTLKTLLVFDEVHRLLPKYGGKKAHVKLEQAVREFRKWGIGLLMISQVLTDFKGAIRGNIATEIQMLSRYEGDIKRVRERHGAQISKLISKLPVGIGMVEAAGYNAGNPYFVEFRPILHSPLKLTEQELKKYLKEKPVLVKPGAAKAEKSEAPAKEEKVVEKKAEHSAKKGKK